METKFNKFINESYDTNDQEYQIAFGEFIMARHNLKSKRGKLIKVYTRKLNEFAKEGNWDYFDELKKEIIEELGDEMWNLIDRVELLYKRP